MKTLRIVVWLGLVIIALILSDTVSAQPNLQVGSATGAPGEAVTIPVTFTNIAGDGAVVGIQFDVQFNSTQFVIESLADGSALSPHLRHSSNPSAGTLRVLVRPEVTPTLPNINSGAIVNISFTIDAGATPGTYDLTLAGIYFSDKSANLVPAGALTGGQLTVGSPDISVSATAVNFLGVKVGTPSTKSVTVSNSVTATANLTITAVEITGSSDFNQTNNCSSLTPGGFCTVNITFTPSSSGSKTATLNITSNDPDESPFNIDLTGSGGVPQILVRRVILGEDFTAGIPGTWTNEDAWGTGCGRVIGAPFAAPWAIVDPNCGGVSEELLSTPYFDASTCTEVALLFSNQFSHGTATTATVSATDHYGKTWREVETLTDDEGPAWKGLDLDALAGAEGAQIEFGYSTGGGFWAIDNVWVLCQPAGLSFKALEGSSSTAQTVLITNTGNANLSITSVSLSGTDASQFQIMDEDCTGEPVAPLASCGIQVAFVPGSTGDKDGKLAISSDDSDHSTLEVPLGGKGVLLLANPDQGTLGSELKIMGSEFGTKKGKVLVGGAALKVLEWGPDLIRGLLSKVVTLGACQVTVVRKEPKGADPIGENEAFSVETPKIWRVVPDHGGVGTSVTITGKYFGTKKGKVTIGGKSGKVTDWAMDATTGTGTIHFLVPKGLTPATYDLKVINKVGEGTDRFEIE